MEKVSKNRKLRLFLAAILIITLACPAAFATTSSSADNVESAKLESLKIVEVMTNSNAWYVGRRAAAANTYPDNKWQDVVNDTLRVDYIAGPRELDDYRLMGLYAKAGVPYDISQVRLTDAQATAKYGADYPKYQALAKEVSDQVYAGLTKGQGVVLVGETCSTAVGTAGGMRRAFGDDVKLGIIYFDAHGDINTKYSTFSGMMGGMPLAPILGLDQEEWWNAGSVGMKPFDASLHAGAREDEGRLDFGFDENDKKDFGEHLNFKEAGTIVVDTDGFIDEANFRKKVKELADKVDVIYLHIDMDIVDNAYSPNVSTPEYNGPDIWTVLRNIKIVMETNKVAVYKLASVYFGHEDFEDTLKWQGFTFPEVKKGETAQQASNRVSQISILTGLRMTGTALENWKSIVLPAPGSGVTTLPAVVATQTSAKVLVNGLSVEFDAYTINDNNYFKLRDLAFVLNGTEKQFEVGYDSKTKAITLTSGEKYTEDGSEMKGKGAGTKAATPSKSAISIDGKAVSLTAYLIEGNNYFKLRDIGAAFDFGVDWDAKEKTISIDTSKGYTPE